MSKTIDQGKEEVVNLCQYFTTNREVFLAPGINEAHVRQSLIDPFFSALGWDVSNKAMIAPQYREVIPEDSLDVEGHQKAPDYTFRVGTLRKFFAEAKKCAVNIGTDPAPAFQLRRYGFSGKLALSILTDFEELGVYDCTSRPYVSDKASHARIQHFRYDEYPDRWRELWDVFSREAVWSGAFDQYAASKRKRGTSEVDVEFLNEMENWRLTLAGNIALRNSDLSLGDLNTAVQLTIDRIVFLRMAEDRGLEPYEQLLKLCERPDIYSRFIRGVCREADEKYNSGLFHFRKEIGVREAPEQITSKLTIDDKVLKPILQSLYFAYGSPYHFGVMPVEILGTVYERFLGKIIRLTPGHQAKIEDKPEVRHAGGVYYTPSYIVEYIIKHTVGQAIEGRSPSQLASYRVLDMACGSGSFLLGAYQTLLDYYLTWYVAHKPEVRKKAVYRDPRDGQWRLMIEEKKRILITHLFGVDIDAQAVEVTKLSLLLKVLEGETDQSLSLSQFAFGDRALPNLADNIQCGNSLISTDDFKSRLLSDPEDLERINPFDWKQRFPDAIKDGGFDCIVGNPPYIRVQTLQEWAPFEVEFYKTAYSAASAGNYDIYVVFVEKGLSLLNKQGTLGFILPHKFFNAKYGEPLRSLVATGRHISKVVHFGHQQVFQGASNYTCLLFLTKAPSKEFEFIKAESLEMWRASGDGKRGRVLATTVGSADWTFSTAEDADLFDKLRKMPLKFVNVTNRIFQGLKTSADQIYIVEELARKQDFVQVYSREKGEEYWMESALLHPLIKGGDSKRYWLERTNLLILFPYVSKESARSTLISENDIKHNFPLTWKYLLENKRYLENRERGKLKVPNWYAYGRSQALDVMALPKIFTPDIAARAAFSLDAKGDAFFTGGVAGGYGILVKPEYSRQYILGLLNSKLLEWYIRQTATPMRGGYYSYESRFIRHLPIKADFLDSADKARHDKLTALVDLVLGLNTQILTAKATAQKELLRRQADAMDAEIDQIVYRIYGLTADEIALVESTIV